MKTKSWSVLTVVIISAIFFGCSSTQKSMAAEAAPAVLQMRLVAETVGGDCDCDDMEIVHKNGDTTQKELFHVLHAVLMDEKDLKSARVDNDNFGRPQIWITFNANGKKKFAEVTRNNIGKQLAMIIGGKLYSAPVIRTEIPGGEGIISGTFSEEEAKELAAKLNAAVKK